MEAAELRVHEIAFKNPWVYICDADERVPPELAQEILRTVFSKSTGSRRVSAAIQNIYLGKWIKHASSYPVWIMRLVRPQRVTYEVARDQRAPDRQRQRGIASGAFHPLTASTAA